MDHEAAESYSGRLITGILRKTVPRLSDTAADWATGTVE